jgi:phage terminase small subunit
MFAKEYVRLGVGTSAAKNAGDAENSAYNEANRLLKNDDVRLEIERIRAKVERAETVTRAYVIAGLQQIAENGQTERVLSELSGPVRNRST